MSAPTMYAVTASRENTHTTASGSVYRGEVQLPTFYLDSRVQGILDVEAAERVARRILGADCVIQSVVKL